MYTFYIPFPDGSHSLELGVHHSHPLLYTFTLYIHIEMFVFKLYTNDKNLHPFFFHCCGKLHVYKMLMPYLPPAHSSFPSYSAQFIPVLGLHICDLLVNFFHCLVIFHFLLGGFFSSRLFISLCEVFFNVDSVSSQLLKQFSF